MESTVLPDTIRLSILTKIGELEMVYRTGFWDTISTLANQSLEANPNKKEKRAINIFLANSLNNAGFIHDHEGNIIKALDYFHKSLEIRRAIGDKIGIANSLNNIGYVHDLQEDYENALSYYYESLAIRKEIGFKRGIAISLNNIGSIYDHMGNTTKALEYYHKSLPIRKEVGDKRGTATVLNNIGKMYSSQKEYEKSLKYHYRSLKIRNEIKDKRGIAQSYVNLATIELEHGSISTAQEFAEKSLKISQEIGYPKYIEASAKTLSSIYKQQGKGLQALDKYELYITMRDSINNLATQTATAKQQAKYEYEKQKVVDDADHDKLLLIAKEKKEKQEIMTGAAVIVLMFVIIFLFFLFNRLKVTKRQKQVIEVQKEIVEEAHQEIKDSIVYAKRIQTAILPPAKLVKKYLKESFILYKPKDVVAGDFYWMEHKENKVLFAAADCTGHGVPGAMVSVVCNNGLNKAVRECALTDPGQILDKTREIVIQEFEKSEDEVSDGMDIALCSLEGMKLEYAGAHNPLWIIRNGSIIETKANKQPIGQFDNPEPYTTHSFELEKGDSIYIFSDGYVDQFGGQKGKKFKAKAFRELLLSIQEKSMEVQKVIIDDTFETWKGSLDQIDDVCVIGVNV